MKLPSWVACCLLILTFCFHVRLDAAEDLRTQFGTRSQAAADALAKAINLSQEGKHKEALVEVNKALAADKDLQMALYWKALITQDLGDIDAARAAYTACIALKDTDRGGPQITVDAMINMGLLHADLQETETASNWLARAILEDPKNAQGLRWKAYRNLAITLFEQKKFLAATIAAVLARQDNPDKVERQMITDFYGKIQNEEVARLLALEYTPPPIAARPNPGQLTLSKSLSLTNPEINLLPDLGGKYLVVLTEKTAGYTLVSLNPTIVMADIKMEATVTAGCWAGDHLYLATSNPTRLALVEPATGKVQKSWDLTDPAPYAIGVIESQGLAFFPYKRQLALMDLSTGKTGLTSKQCLNLAVDPAEKYLYTFFKEDREPTTSMFVIDGRPVIFERADTDWQQSELYKFAVTNGELVLAEYRLNAASNGNRLILSPEGDWVALVGGGGWRPNNGSGGYGTAVFSAGNLEKLQGFFSCEAYPTWASINPVTHQFALCNGKSIRLYHLNDNKKVEQEIKTKDSKHGCWCGSGKYLAIAQDKKTLELHANPLSAQETQLAQKWFAPFQAVKAVEKQITQKAAAADPAFQRFTLSADVTQTRAMLDRALANTRAMALPDWVGNPLYPGQNELQDFIGDCNTHLAANNWTGIDLYKIKKTLAANPGLTPLNLYLGAAYAKTGQMDNAKAALLEAIHTDARRTRVTIISLEVLSDYLADSDVGTAGFCVATALSIDPHDPALQNQMLKLLDKLHLETYRPKLQSLVGSAVNLTDKNLEKFLPQVAPEDDKSPALEGPALYQKMVPSVFLVETPDGSGSAVCINNGVALTNYHVVSGNRTVQLTAFRYQNNKLKATDKIRAKVVYSNSNQDLALLQFEMPADAKIAPFRPAAPPIGEKVYAVGSPGMGDQILELSMTDGIVSGLDRQVEGQAFLQFTAATNPGNSGGPLVDNHGRVIGIITLKAHLQNTNFAIPTTRALKVIQDNLSSIDEMNR